MITEYDLQEAIAECEGQRNPTATTCLKLAAFYTIRDKLYPAKKEEPELEALDVPRYSYSSQSYNAVSDTEFMQAITSIDAKDFLSIMDELMSTLKAIMPRLYDGVMRKLTEDN